MTLHPHSISLVLGDWSRDGHGKVATFYIRSNLTKEELSKAYSDGVKVVKVDLTENVCRHYEDYHIAKETIAKFCEVPILCELLKAYIEDPMEEYFDSATGKVLCDEDLFGELWLAICKVGSPEFTFEYVEEGDAINIGGYGLFS